MGDPELAPQLEEATNKIKRLEILIDTLEVKLHKTEKELEQERRKKLADNAKQVESVKVKNKVKLKTNKFL